ncbi:MAG TPA: carboxypeptidase regulatory-like domain-containing protein [Ktedonobacterales bacterium]
MGRVVAGVFVLLLAACARGATSQTIISGKVLGQSALARQSGKSVLIGLSAQVRCNGVAATTAADGSFTLRLPPADSYTCAVTPPTAYSPATATLSQVSAQRLSITFGNLTGANCNPARNQPDSYACPAPRLRGGSLRGKVVNAASGAAMGGARVRCVESTDSVQQVFTPSSTLTARTSASGAFTLTNVPVGSYGCIASVAGGGESYLHVAVGPATASALTFPICQRNCPAVHYHDGPVMHTSTAYLIFWQPQGSTYGARSGDAAFQAAMGQYFRDVNGSAFYGMLGQYFDFQGNIQNRVSLGGMYVDTTPFQHCAHQDHCQHAAASQSDPLYDEDIAAEVRRVMGTQHWTGGTGNLFFVFLPMGAQACQDRTADAACTFIKHNQAFCGYHSWLPQGNGPPTIYATISDAGTARAACINPIAFRVGPSPHGDWLLDAELSTLSHEHIESVTDPMPTQANQGGWYDASAHPLGNSVEEIADRCQEVYGVIRADGSNVTLGNGHRYILQAEWSNAAGTCVVGG